MSLLTEYLNTRKPSEFLFVLKKQQITEVIDVRYSDRYPIYYTRLNLETFLNLNNIRYSDYRALGNPPYNRPTKAHQDISTPNLNRFIPHQEPPLNYRQTYETYLQKSQKNKFRELQNLITKHPENTFCLICYCATLDPQRCHRFWLAELLSNP
jgi:hypothetical protein